MVESFPDIPILRKDQESTLKSLKDGGLDDLRVDKKLEVDDIVEYGLDLGFLKDILGSFPGPRKSFDILLMYSSSRKSFRDSMMNTACF